MDIKRKTRGEAEKSKVPLCRKTGCWLFPSAVSRGVMATELLHYFMYRSKASHRACVTTGCTMSLSHDITAARLRACETFSPELKASLLLRKQDGIIRTIQAATI